MAEHVVVVGLGRVGEHIVRVLERLQVPHLVVEEDAARAAAFQERGVLTLFGDAANSEVLTHAGLEHASALVVTVPDETDAELIVIAAHELAPKLPIIARAATTGGVKRLTNHGAQGVIHPELEGGLEIVRHTLLALDFPMMQVQQYTDAVRNDTYDTLISTQEERLLLDQLVSAVRGMEISWSTIAENSTLIGQTLAEGNLRAQTGASVIALVRNHQLLANPKSTTIFASGDTVGLIGDVSQVALAERIINPQLAEEQTPETEATHREETIPSDTPAPA